MNDDRLQNSPDTIGGRFIDWLCNRIYLCLSALQEETENVSGDEQTPPDIL